MARQFNGTSQYGVCSAELLSANVNYTLVVYFKIPTTQATRGYLAGSGRSSNAFARGNGIMLRGDQAGDPIAAYGTDGSDVFLNGSGVSEGAWHVAAATRVGGGQSAQATQLKIDGLTKVTGTTPGGASGTANNFLVGANRTNTGFIDFLAGLIDAIAIYNVVKPDAFLDALSSFAEPDEEDADLVELWRFDSDTGSTSTGINGNVITWVNSPAYVADTPFAPAGPALTVSSDPITGSVSGTTDISTTATDYRITAGGVTITQALDGSPVTGTSFAIASLARGNLPALASVSETSAQATVELMNGETVIDSDTVDLATPAGTFAAVVASPDTTSAESIYNPLYCDGTPANGDQHQYTTPDGVVIDSAGLVTGEGEFSVRHWELAAGTWGSWASYTVQSGVIVPITPTSGLLFFF